MNSSPVQIDRHEPERRRKPVTTMYCGCSCCCCCCLHTVGAIIAAAVAPAIGRGTPMPISYYYDEEIGQPVPYLRKAGFSAVTVFWWVLCGLMLLSFAYGFLMAPDSVSTLLITGLVLVMVLPVLQLASAILTVILFAVWPRPDKAYQLKQLAKISCGIILGTMFGLLVMGLLGAMMGMFH